ncbi:MAG: beta strand repeat-containing protein [Stenotrophobium sp.]
MRKSNFLNIFGAMLAMTMLAGCGGGASFATGSSGGFGGSSSGGSSGSSGGTTGSGIVASVTLTAAQTSAVANGSSSTALTAKLIDTTGAPIQGKTLNFSTNAGLLSSAPPAYATTSTGTTDSNGVVIVYLQSSKQQGTATVTATEPVTGVSSNASVTFVAGPAMSVSIVVAPTSVAPAATASVNAQATDQFGNPVSGTLVTFGFNTAAANKGNTSGGQFATTLVTTDSNGRASTTYQAGPTQGTDVLEASLAGGQNSTTSLSVAPGSVSQIGSVTLTLGAATAAADGSTQTAVNATVNGSGNTPLTGVTVSFSTSAGQLKSGSTNGVTVTAVTNSNGVAQVFQISPKQAGTGTITASTGGFSASQSITFVSSTVAHVTVNVSPATVAPNGTASITAQLTDTNGNIVANHTVQFSAPSGQFSGGGTLLTATTNANGVATANYTAPASGTTSITATAEPENIFGSAPVTVSATAVPVTGVTVTAGPASIPANGSTSLVRATVSGSGGPLQGISVNFSTTAGTLSSPTATTDVNGNASVTLTSSSTTVPVTATVTAATGGVSGTAQVSFTVSTPSSVNLSLSPASVSINGATTVRAMVLDSNNNPVSGAAVNFSVTPNNSNGTLSSSSATTNASGVATTTYTAGSNVTAGGTATDTIQASVAGVSSSASLTVTNTVQVSTISLIASAPQLLSSASTAAAPPGVTLTAVVKDPNNNVVPNVAVQFTAKPVAGSLCGSGGALLVISGTTNSSGQAQAILFTGGDPTNQTIAVTATTSGKTANLSIPETGTHITISGPSAVGLNANPAASYTITLLDAGNNPISGQTLAVTSALGNAVTPHAGSSLMTNANGQIVVDYASTHSGSDTLTAAPSGCATYAAQATQAIQVATQNLVITAPTANAQIPFGASGTFSLGAAVAAGGSNYIVGDVLTVNGGTLAAGGTAAQLTVSQVTAGAITAVTVTNAGTYTTLPPSPATATGGSGTGASFNIAVNVSVQLTGGTVSGHTIQFTATRGTLNSLTAPTNASGVASDAIYQPSSAGNAGGAVVTATCTDCSPQISTSVGVQFNATTPSTVSLQANPTTVAINGTSTITATVRDTHNNLVANQLVNFTLTDDSGGTLTQSSATTNASGQAIVTYKAGASTSSRNGVSITGTVNSISPTPAYTVAAATVIANPAATGYAIGDVLNISGGTVATGGTAAQLKVSSLGIDAASVTNGGTYSVLPTSPAAVTGGNGSGATFSFTQTNVVATATVSTGGTGYVVGDVLTVSGGTGSSAATLQVTSIGAGGTVSAITIVSGGSYSVVPGSPASVTGGTGTGAKFNVTSGLAIASATVVAGGAGYQNGDILTLAGGSSTTAAQLKVTSATLVGTVAVSSGGTYSTAPGNPASTTDTTNPRPTNATFNLTQVKLGTVLLSVGGQSLRIVLGTGNTITALNTTQYQVPYSVLVTDPAGNPPPAGSVVTLVTNAIAYQKGQEIYNGTLWVPVYAVSCGSDPGCATTASFGCFNEDHNLNGILDPGEDYNGNGQLDPGTVTTVPTSVTLDANGTGQFNITYPKDRANWVQVFITAAITVNGNQGQTQQNFVLPGLSTDFTSQTVAPPGEFSPYGQASVCSNPN